MDAKTMWPVRAKASAVVRPNIDAADSRQHFLGDMC
jgi:hypothetical protein